MIESDPFDICLNQGTLVGQIREEGICVSGGKCQKYHKIGCNRREGRGNKDFENGGGGQAGSRTVPLDVSPPCSVLVNNA